MTGGCAMLQGRDATPAPPPLEVPVVPPRTVTAAPSAEPGGETDSTSEVSEVEVPVLQGSPLLAPAVGRDTDAETAPEAAEETEEPADLGQVPALRLRPLQMGDDTETADGIRGILARAAGRLNGLAGAELSEGARAQYDTARRFIEQAEAALGAQNLIFAQYLADKAETLARELEARR